MTLIKSISGIRGTIGGSIGEGLSPIDTVKFTSAYAFWLQQQNPNKKLRVVVGRDARISGKMVLQLVCGTLMGCGIDVVDADLATTPTVEMAVTFNNADGGIILTASHNPKQWSALKLLNGKGEFLNAADGEVMLAIAEKGDFSYAFIDDIGRYSQKSFTEQHIQAVLNHPLVDVEAIYRAGFKVVLDAVNSVGGIAIPMLLEAMGVNCVKLYCEPNGEFPHNPEPLPEHLTEISAKVKEEQADLGIVVDPDVDRLALVCENGEMFGEEYTLVAVADYVLSQKPGNTVSNLSSSRALRDITEKHGEQYFASAVGEVNVVTMMKEKDAVIGGEGNGGIIMPDLHYGRDALIGVALFLTHLAKQNKKASELRAEYPPYFISKNKLELTPNTNMDALLDKVKKHFATEKINDIDGVRVDFEKDKKWVHLRKSNTESIIRIYAEASTMEPANELADQVKQVLKS
ncbi:MAG: phosphoglucosamine mutase [Prevotellaceae bacterium]|jgi:phosphomannomutase|nr:phosphoglucosamine mutase [Prevotellaceae bacterium]